MDKTKQEKLLQERKSFIEEEGYGLNHLQDVIDKLLPDKCTFWTAWTTHANELISAWERIKKAGEIVPWPDVCPTAPYFGSSLTR
jgi:hypothetical protein